MHTDDVLWDALERVQLKRIIMKEMSMGLESQVEAAGVNLSLGQKQLICLARAIVKKAKILCIDEATSNVDIRQET
jgi:ABC-type multidrug transport system fused ATPase/permease subunit